MRSHLDLVAAHPIKFCLAIYETLALLVLLLFNRILLPFACRPISLRTEIARCFLGGFLKHFWDILFKAPPGLQETEYRNVIIGSVPTVIVPPHARLDVESLDRHRPSLVLLYAHGGGYLFGEPLMYMSTYKRWIELADSHGMDLSVIAVHYRSTLFRSDNVVMS
jgi:hypothetical protein